MFKQEFLSRLMIRPVVAWYDCWIGWFFDKKKRILYILPVPMFGVKIRILPEPEWGVDSLCYKCGWTGHHSDLLEEYDDELGYLGHSHCPDCGSKKIKDYSPITMSGDDIPF